LILSFIAATRTQPFRQPGIGRPLHRNPHREIPLERMAGRTARNKRADGRSTV